MATMMQIPEVEARVAAADKQPPNLALLRECVEAIASAMRKTAKADEIDFHNEDHTTYRVTVGEGKYLVSSHHTGVRRIGMKRPAPINWPGEFAVSRTG